MTSIDKVAAQDTARTYADNSDAGRAAALAAAARQAAQANLRIRAQDTDSVTLSNDARSRTFANQAVQNAPDVRDQKVADIKQQVSDGTYQVSASMLARKMLNPTII
jgi:negative regulator of flagellin synthesis FlgM